MPSVPQEFLVDPAPNIEKNIIDFSQTSLPEYHGLYAVILDNVLTSAECRTFIHIAESQTNGQWERALINAGLGQQKLHSDYRNSGRIMWDSEDMVARIWKRCERFIPEISILKDRETITGPNPVRLGQEWNLTRLNERMRFLRYENGEFFREHVDAAFHTPDGREQSFFTLHLYLNGADADADATSDTELAKMDPEAYNTAMKSELRGGATTFHSRRGFERLDVLPKTGRVLIFQHRGLLHSGDDVVQGVKYTMRTDVMYSLAEK